MQTSPRINVNVIRFRRTGLHLPTDKAQNVTGLQRVFRLNWPCRLIYTAPRHRASYTTFPEGLGIYTFRRFIYPRRCK